MALQLFKIASTTVETPQGQVDFTSIPSGYTDLKIVVSARSDRAATDDYIDITFNGNKAANYTLKALYGNGSTAASTGTLINTNFYNAYGLPAASNTALTFGNAEIYIPNYGSSSQKSFQVDAVSENNATSALIGLNAGLWNQTTAITSVNIYPAYGNTFVANSTFTLYGVL